MSDLAIFESVVDLSAIDRAALASSTRLHYKRALTLCFDAGVSLWDYSQLANYAYALKPSARAYLKAGIRILVGDVASQLKAGAVPDNLAVVSAALLRLESLSSAVKVEASRGERVHTWLTREEVGELLSTCGDDRRGWRDWVVLALQVGAGLRRSEVVSTRINNVVLVPVEGRAALQITGKGNKSRVVPIAGVLYERLGTWSEMIGGGLLARSLTHPGGIGESLSAAGVYDIVKTHGAVIGKNNLAPHDLRRSFAQLGYQAGIPVVQISRLLGHSSIVTTQRYLNLNVDFAHTVSDVIPLDYGLEG